MDLTDLWRACNALIATAALIALSLRARVMWNTWSERIRYLAVALGLFLGTTVYGSIESVVQGNHFGMRTMMTTLACAWTLHALVKTPPTYTEDRSFGPKYSA